MSLKIKIPFIFTLFLLALVIVIGYFVYKRVDVIATEETERTGKYLIKILISIDKSSFLERNYPIIATFLQKVAQHPDILCVGYEDMDGIKIMEEKKSDKKGIVLREPIKVEGEKRGCAYLVLSENFEKKAKNAIIQPFLYIFFISGLISIIVGIITGVYISLPIIKVSKKVEQFGKGNYESRIRKYKRGEIGVLARTFNEMADNLEKAYKELEEKYKEINHLYKLATEDSLTKLYIRRHFFEKLTFEKKLTRGKILYLMMIDIDDFKSINDRFGHDVGDKVIVGIAKIIKDEIGNKGFSGRYGGEEFVCAFYNNKDIPENVRKRVENTRLINEIRITVSIGVTIFDENNTIEEIIKKSDQALYKAKNSGKNRVIWV